MEELSDDLKEKGDLNPQLKSQKNLASKIFTSSHLDEIGFLVILLLMLIFSFLFFYYGLPILLDKFNIISLRIFF